MNANRGIPGGLLVPNIKMYKRDVLPTFMDIIRTNGIRYKYNKSELRWFFPGTGSEMYVFHSEDDGQSIRGPNLGWGAINEVTLCSRMAYLAFLSRMRHAKSKLLQTIMSGTPEGFNWTYEDLVENPPEDLHLIFGDARENTFLHPSYFKDLEGAYDEQMQKMYIGGEFINLSGNRAVYAFNRQKHVSEKYTRIPDTPVLVALDFNVNPMAASLCNIVVEHRNRSGLAPKTRLRVFDEIKIKGADTWQFCEVLKRKLDIPISTSHDAVTIYPDPSGVAHSTKSRYTDIEILESEGFTNIKYKRAPSVRDSLNALNNLYSRNAIEVYAGCKNFIADHEQCVLKKDKFELDKSNPGRTHWVDGIRYLVEHEFPIYKRKPAREVRYL